MASSPASEIVTFAEFEADLRARELRRHGAKVKLPDQSFQVLVILLAHPGELVTREEIRNRLWPGDTFVDFDHGLNNAVNRLREALGDSADSPRWIETLPRRGYRFISVVNGGSLANGVVSEARPMAADPEQNGVDAVSVLRAEKPKYRNYRWLLWAAPAMVVVALLIAFELQKAPVVPSSRAFVLPPDDTTFNLIGDNGGSVALSADGGSLAFVAINRDGSALIWVRSLGKLLAEPLEGTEGATFPFWSPDGHWIAFFADGKLKKISLDGSSAVTLCDAPFGRGGSWNRDGVMIFAPASHGGIYKIPDSGGVPTPVTNVNTSIHTTHRWPKFLPDGRHFIYLAASHFADTSHNGVYVGSLYDKESKLLIHTDADATYASGYLFFLRKNVLVAQPFDFERGRLLGEPRPTVEKVLYDFSIWKAVFDASENGVMAYQLGVSVSGSQLRWFDRSGKQLEGLGEPGFQWDPSLSHDGRKLAENYAQVGSGYGSLWVYDLASSVRAQITFGKNDKGTPIWSRDDTQIVFAGKRQHYSLYQVDSSGAEQERLILDTGNDTWPYDLSPDGRFLLFGQGLNIGRAQSQLWVYPIKEGTKPFRLLEGESVEVDGQFSPNGRWVAYSSNQSGRDEVYVVPFPALSSDRKNVVAGRKWQVSLSGGHQPRWRRDCKELFYMAADNTLIAVPVMSRGSKFEAGPAHPLFRTNPPLTSDHFSYDVLPGGSRFIVNTAAPERAAPITLVENWLSDFKK